MGGNIFTFQQQTPGGNIIDFDGGNVYKYYCSHINCKGVIEKEVMNIKTWYFYKNDVIGHFEIKDSIRYFVFNETTGLVFTSEKQLRIL